jgi:ribosomal protein L22
MSETPEEKDEALVPDPQDTVEQTPDVVATPEAETTTPPAGDELQAAVDDASDAADEPEAAEDDETVGADEPVAEDKPKRGRRRNAQPEAPKQPAPTRRRSRRDPSEPAPVVRAQAKYVRSSARKARLVCDHIRGKSVEEARAILAVTPRAIAEDWSKLLESAVANAEHNHELVGEDLYVKAVHADEGPTIKRFRPRAQGRATRIRKRTSHLTILLTPKD